MPQRVWELPRMALKKSAAPAKAAAKPAAKKAAAPKAAAAKATTPKAPAAAKAVVTVTLKHLAASCP